ncbi:GDSL esterase/lipase At5g03610-like [Pistacia vera]|uniref:GDSL esterase/lipase At5g03610-like n=1 Tax=Pistacia vera TaxID=55513 RepID=UPI001262C7C4|nr:GDSL esterase/lipase At5g03610-like [Pistacia vera]XP_031268729.1 GDSL esterase/lipase At5g03610-like [Pistacia vera]
MEKRTHFLFLVLFLLLTAIIFTAVLAKKGRNGHHHHHHHHPGSVKLFVFGDSYADTGNWGKSAASWNEPYGLTYPGKPAGRFSDGRVLTDFLASHLGMKSPIPFEMRKSENGSNLQHGMNFAYGGTGVFNTMANEPNMTVQINNFQQQLEENVFTKHDLNSSIALVSLAGNDYLTYIMKNDINNVQGLQDLTKNIIQQLLINMKRLQAVGIKKIAVTTVEPMGCLPNAAVVSSYQNCSEIFNAAAKYHNEALVNEVQKLNNENKDSVIFLLDLYAAFMSTLTKNGKLSGNSEMKTLLQPCCVGLEQKYFCGSIDDSGAKKYSVCKHPELSFFWDDIHPSENGWKAVYYALRSTLDEKIR